MQGSLLLLKGLGVEGCIEVGWFATQYKASANESQAAMYG